MPARCVHVQGAGSPVCVYGLWEPERGGGPCGPRGPSPRGSRGASEPGSAGRGQRVPTLGRVWRPCRPGGSSPSCPGSPLPASPRPGGPSSRGPGPERGSAAAAASGGRRHLRDARSRRAPAAENEPRSGEQLPGRRRSRARAPGAGHLLDVLPHLRAVVADHQQLQRVVHEPVLWGQTEACASGIGCRWKRREGEAASTASRLL